MNDEQQTITYPADYLRNFATEVFMYFGVPKTDADRVRLIGPHVCLGFLKCRLSRSSTLCGDLKGSTHGAKETAHLRDIWHDLTVFYRCVELPQKQVVFSQVLVYRD